MGINLRGQGSTHSQRVLLPSVVGHMPDSTELPTIDRLRLVSRSSLRSPSPRDHRSSDQNSFSHRSCTHSSSCLGRSCHPWQEGRRSPHQPYGSPRPYRSPHQSYWSPGPTSSHSCQDRHREYHGQSKDHHYCHSWSQQSSSLPPVIVHFQDSPRTDLLHDGIMMFLRARSAGNLPNHPHRATRIHNCLKHHHDMGWIISILGLVSLTHKLVSQLLLILWLPSLENNLVQTRLLLRICFLLISLFP